VSTLGIGCKLCFGRRLSGGAREILVKGKEHLSQMGEGRSRRFAEVISPFLFAVE